MKKYILLLLLSIHVMALADVKPDFKVVDTSGKIWTAKNTTGKFLIINFWATWCPPCVKEIPEFVDFYDKHKDKVEILGFDYEDKSKKKVLTFADGFMVNYPIVLPKNQKKEFEKFSINFLPTSYIYNTQGTLIHIQKGKINSKQLEKIMKL